MQAFNGILSWAKRRDRHLTGVWLAGGFAFDSWGFGRIDRPETQAVFIVYLLVAGITIAILHGLESRAEGRKPSDKTRSILIFMTQFALGALLSSISAAPRSSRHGRSCWRWRRSSSAASI